jgi:MFS superfamily sulfate permease-like transporter
MELIRSALLTAERWLDWLPNWVVSTVIIVLAVAVASPPGSRASC